MFTLRDRTDVNPGGRKKKRRVEFCLVLSGLLNANMLVKKE
jgi:hypothetical protein